MTAPPHIIWFKRDLRVHDHQPLYQAAQSGGVVIPLYIVEPELWQQPFASSRHWQFVHDCLRDLNNSLNALGQPLIIRIGDACNVLAEIADSTGAQTIWAHEETGNGWTYGRDLAVHRMCRDRRLAFHELPANGVVRRLGSRDDWSALRYQRMAAPITPNPTRLTPVAQCPSDALPAKDHPMFGAPLPAPQRGGRRAAVADLRSFLEQRATG
jgi:deoxyribodipyrimidine photo-lyase